MNDYKIGYVFYPLTGEFIGTEIVYFEKRIGDYPHASNVVFIEPPKIGENQKQVWTGKDWKIVQDYRDKIYFNDEGDPVGIIKELGEIGDKIIKEPPKVDSHKHIKYNYQRDDWDIILDEGFIKDSESGLIREKTKEELYEEGKITLEEYNEYIRQERQMRFFTETDKMGMMYLRGECTLEEWKSAMDKIREELPKK